MGVSVGADWLAEFPIKACWEVMPSDRVVRPIATPCELLRITILRDWVAQHPILVHLEVLLAEDSLDTLLFPIGHVVPSALDIVIRSLLDSSRKRAMDFPLEGKGKRAS